MEIKNNIGFSSMCLLAQRPMHFFWGCLILTLYNYAKLCPRVYCINLQSHQTYGSSNCSTSSPTSGIFSLLNYIFFGWVMVLIVILLYFSLIANEVEHCSCYRLFDILSVKSLLSSVLSVFGILIWI